MTNDYIRRQDVAEECGEWYVEEGTEEGFIGTVSQMLNMFSPANVTPVVRCKDCKHHAYDEIFSCYLCKCPGRVRATTPDGFCEKGEE